MNNGNRPYRQNPDRPTPEQFDMYAAFRSKERAEFEKRKKADAPNLYDTYRARADRGNAAQNRGKQQGAQNRTRTAEGQQRYRAQTASATQPRQNPQTGTRVPPTGQKPTQKQAPTATRGQKQNSSGYGTRVQSEAGSAYRYGYHSSYRTKDGRILDGFDKTGRPIYRDPYARTANGTASPTGGTAASGVILHNENGVMRGDTRLKPARRVRIETLDDTEKKPFPFKIVLSVLVCTAMVMAVLYTYMELNEQTNALSTLSYRLSSLRSQANTLQAELVRREDLMSIEQTASDVLGMVKTDVLTKEYVSIQNEDKTEVVANLEEEAIRRVTVEIDLSTGKPIDKSGSATTFTPADKVTDAVTSPETLPPAVTEVTEVPAPAETAEDTADTADT